MASPAQLAHYQALAEAATGFAAQANAFAPSEALRRVDLVADWIADEVEGAPNVPLLPRLRNVTPEDLTGQSVAVLLALLLDQGQSTGTTIAARDALAARWLALPHVQALVEAIAHNEAVALAEEALQ